MSPPPISLGFATSCVSRGCSPVVRLPGGPGNLWREWRLPHGLTQLVRLFAQLLRAQYPATIQSEVTVVYTDNRVVSTAQKMDNRFDACTRQACIRASLREARRSLRSVVLTDVLSDVTGFSCDALTQVPSANPLTIRFPPIVGLCRSLVMVFVFFGRLFGDARADCRARIVTGRILRLACFGLNSAPRHAEGARPAVEARHSPIEFLCDRFQWLTRIPEFPQSLVFGPAPAPLRSCTRCISSVSNNL
jgi:hypothetical protein